MSEQWLPSASDYEDSLPPSPDDLEATISNQRARIKELERQLADLAADNELYGDAKELQQAFAAERELREVEQGQNDSLWNMLMAVAPELTAERERAEKVIDELITERYRIQAELQAEREKAALQRKQLRNAWAKLECRCIFNDQDEITFQDPHCPYHGGYQNDPDGWDPIGELRAEIKRLAEAGQ